MKVCIVCYDYKESNLRLQPWRYIFEISKGMKKRDIDVEIITDGLISTKKEIINGVDVNRIKSLSSNFFSKNSMIIELIEEISPDIILWSFAPTSVYLLKTIEQINIPIIGLWFGSNYKINDIFKIGLGELIRNFPSLRYFILSALIPKFLINKLLMKQNIKSLIVLNDNIKTQVSKYNFTQDKIFTVPTGITEFDLIIPSEREIKKIINQYDINEKSFKVLYLGSPLSLRGCDTLINAVADIKEMIFPLELIILSRRKNDYIQDEKYLKNLCHKRKIDKFTRFITGFLDKEEIKIFIRSSDVVVLPFKIVQSDTPIAILEAFAMGRPVISTKIDGIPELIEDKHGILVKPNNTDELANSLNSIYSNDIKKKEMGIRARNFMLKYPTWDSTSKKVMEILNEIIIKGE